MVMIDSGQFKLMRNVDVSHQPSRAKVYEAWSWAFGHYAAEAMTHLADVIEDVYTYELWRDKYLPGPEQFFERIGIFGLDLDEPARLIKELRKKKSKHKDKILQRVQEAKRLREEGKTQQQIAEELKVSQRQVSTDLSLEENKVPTQKTSKPKRKQPEVRIRPGTKPEDAAQNIRKIFGDEFLIQLRDEIDRLTAAKD